MLKKVASNKAFLIECMQQQSFVRRIWRGEANFVLARVDDARQLIDHCARNRITIRMFEGQAMLKNCIRISVGSASEMQALSDTFSTFEPGPARKDGGSAHE